MVKVNVINPAQFKNLVKTGKPTYRVVPVDATWYMGDTTERGKQEFLKQGRLPSAAFFDLDEVCLPKSKTEYPHMLADYDTLHQNLNFLGLNRTDKLVFYDRQGIFSGPRAAWNLILAGHKQVFLLDHYKDYVKEELPLDTTEIAATATDAVEASLEYDIIEEEEFEANLKNQVINFDELFEYVKNDTLKDDYVTFDARSNDRYTGESPEPRKGISSGHVKSALSLPFKDVLNENGNFKTKDEIIDLFKTRFKIDLTKDLPGKKGIIVMCGTGVTAVILRLAIESVAESKIPIRVYDGSWTEWASRVPDEYIVKGDS